MNEADSLLPSLEQGLDGAWDTEEIALGEGTPYARVRVLMARAMERLAGQALLSRLPQVSSQDVRRDLSLLCRVEARQEASWTAAGSLGAGEEGLYYALLSLEMAAAPALRMKDGPVRQALHFVLPEYLDELYRLSNLLMLTEGKSAGRLLRGYAEIMPGRPLIACHRHPYDDVRHPAQTEDTLEKMAPIFMTAAEEAKRDFYLRAAASASLPLARALYRELALLSLQHQAHFQSLLPNRPPLKFLLLCQYAEGYLYDSFAREEGDGPLGTLFHRERDHELAHIRKITDMQRKQKGERAKLPPFPEPLCMGFHKGYVRDALQSVGVTALRENYVPVGTLSAGADFFRYQRRACPEDGTPSHQVVAALIEKTGEDYRFEIAPHPVEALRDRHRDHTEVGR